MFLRAERDRERCARRNVASILNSTRELGIRDAQGRPRNSEGVMKKTRSTDEQMITILREAESAPGP